jgi:hypothetical protein
MIALLDFVGSDFGRSKVREKNTKAASARAQFLDISTRGGYVKYAGVLSLPITGRWSGRGPEGLNDF